MVALTAKLSTRKPGRIALCILLGEVMLNKGGLEALMVVGGVILWILGFFIACGGIGLLMRGHIILGIIVFVIGAVLFAFILYQAGSHLHNYENECRKQYNLPPK